MELAAKILTLPLALVLLLGAPGCGLVLGYGGPQPVNVTTNPEGAELIVDGMPHAEKAPTTVYLHPKKTHQLRARTPDGKEGATAISKTVRIDVVVLDAVLTLGIGILVDFLSGSLYRLNSPVQINLGSAPPVSAADNGGGAASGSSGAGATGPAADAAPCPICNEPRGDVTPCPHCGLE